MSLTDMLPSVYSLPHEDKVRHQLLSEDLAREAAADLPQGLHCEFWSTGDGWAGAQKLQELLQDTRMES